MPADDNRSVTIDTAGMEALERRRQRRAVRLWTGALILLCAGTLLLLFRHIERTQAFGSNDVLINYSYSTAWGDPAFAVATLR